MHDMGRAAGGLTAILCLCFDHRADIEGLRDFKHALGRRAGVTRAMEASGASDMIVEIAIGDMAHYHVLIDALSEPLRRFVTRYDTSFVSGAADGASSDSGGNDRTFWVRHDTGHRRVDARDIDRVTAERDYVRLYLGDVTLLYHATIQYMADRLCPTPFIRLHRSALVRIDHIHRFVHRDRRWIALLRDGSEQIVSRGYVQGVTRLVTGQSSTDRTPTTARRDPSSSHGDGSSDSDPSVEPMTTPVEKHVN